MNSCDQILDIVHDNVYSSIHSQVVRVVKMSETLRRKYSALYAKRLNEKNMAGCQWPGPNSAYEKLKRANKQHQRVESMYFDDGSWWHVTTPCKKARKALLSARQTA